jgi:GAF domain-containing protein
MISTSRLSDLFVEVADTLVEEFDLIDFLHHVTTSAAEITDSSAVGLMLADPGGDLSFMASSTEDVRLLELFQIQHSEGPCLDAHRTGEEVADIRISQSVQRWPVFGPRALELGFTTAHCFPLRLRDHVIGAMNVFRTDQQFLEHDERRILRALADVATIALMQERTIRRAEELTEQLQFALNSRVVIEQAKGAVARTLDIGVDEAFNLLRAYARRHRIGLTGLARSVVEDRETLRAVIDS